MTIGTASFWAAFSERPVEKIRVINENPPFGHLGDGTYDGLRPETIDCLIIDQVSGAPGLTAFTTSRSRYLNYIVPFSTQL